MCVRGTACRLTRCIGEWMSGKHKKYRERINMGHLYQEGVVRLGILFMGIRLGILIMGIRLGILIMGIRLGIGIMDIRLGLVIMGIRMPQLIPMMTSPSHPGH